MSRHAELAAIPVAECAAADRRHAAGPMLILGRLARAVDGFVEHIYRVGFVQSFTLHVAGLLVLALMSIHVEVQSQPVVLAMRFEGPHEPLLDDEELISLEALAVPEETETIDSNVPALADVPMESAVEVALHEVEVGPGASEHLPEDIDLMATVATVDSTPGPASAQGPRVGSAVGGGQGGVGNGGGGIGGEMGRRLRAAGARSGDVQVSIRWDNLNDIDVHVRVEPFGPGPASMINFVNRRGICGGMLDVDANASPSTVQPVENVFWAAGRAPYGRFTVAVHHFRSWSGQVATPVEVAVLVDGEVHRFQLVVVYGGPPVHVVTFDRKPGDRSALADRFGSRGSE